MWSSHRFAGLWLTVVSFCEAIFFPIPPDVMLIPMSMSKPHLATRYAIYTTLASVLGGMIGYGIGFYAFEWVQQIIINWGYQTQFDKTMIWFEQWGILVVFLAGFSPIPYKIFTICAGVMQMFFFPFVLTATVSRFLRFYLVAKLSAWGGEKYAQKIRKSIEIIGWGVVFLGIIGYFLYQFFK
ncbi:SNARE associated Golgi protein [Phocoenobacter uteri]|uniref:SNARE associated Golgi protein n=2 Tax=Phocoenobacter uteri TaxID=146806 RepID=A0A379CAZ7_9PAST|nr:SNARE associated Golgi protein [Phocoenobacter uteri]